jgi:hypothetical protein
MNGLGPTVRSGPKPNEKTLHVKRGALVEERFYRDPSFTHDVTSFGRLLHELKAF